MKRGTALVQAAQDRYAAERLEQHVTERCYFCDDWHLEGTLAETRAAHLEHRQTHHPDVQPKRQLKPRRKGQINLGKTIDENIAGVRVQGGAGWHRG